MTGGLPRALVALALVSVACTSATDETTTTTSPPPETTTSERVTTSSTTPPSLAVGPDLILVNGRVITVDAESSISEAVAITDGRIAAVGSTEQIEAIVGDNTEVVDLEGRNVVPGIVETHTHWMQFVAPDRDAMRAGHDTLVSWGITTAGMPSVLEEQLPAFREMDAAGDIQLRTQLYLAYNSVCGDELGDFYQSQPFESEPRRGVIVRGVKIFGDGGACRAPAVSFEYGPDTPQELKDAGWIGNGDLYVTSAEVTSVVNAVDAAGGATVIHAIGDTAIATVLSGLRDTATLNEPHQVHHNSLSSLVDPGLLSTYGEKGLTPVLQLMPWAQACDPDRTGLWRALLPDPAFGLVERRNAMADANPGLLFAWHGDGPFVAGSPWEQMFSAVQPGYVQDGEICFPEPWADFPLVSAEEALRMATINAAIAMGIDDELGSIEEGKLADLAILQSDPLDPDHEAGLARNRALATIIGGEMVFCVEICSSFGLDDGTDPLVHVSQGGSCASAQPSAWWRAEGDTEDETGSLSGEPTGSLAYAPGAVGEAWVLSDGGISLVDQPGLVSGFSFEAWVKFDAPGFDDYQNIFNNSQMFIRKNNSAEGNGIGVFVTLADGSVEPRAQTSPVEPGVWYHVAATWDGTDLAVYLNGSLEEVTGRSGILIPDAVSAHLGQGEAAGTDGVFLRGSLDEAAFYARTLGGSDIRTIFEAGSAGKCLP